MDKDSKLISETYLLAKESPETVAWGGEFHALARAIDDESHPSIGRLAAMLISAHQKMPGLEDFSAVPPMLVQSKRISCPMKKKKLEQIHQAMGYVAQDKGGPRAFSLNDWHQLKEVLGMMGQEEKAAQAGEESEKRRPTDHPSFDQPSFGTDYE